MRISDPPKTPVQTTRQQQRSLSPLEHTVEFAKSIEICGWKDRVLQRLEAGNYHAALILCRQALMDSFKMPGTASHSNNIRTLEFMIQSLIRDCVHR